MVENCETSLKVKQLLAEGAFGSVYLVEAQSCPSFALKVVSKERALAQGLNHVKAEFEIHWHLKHSHIIILHHYSCVIEQHFFFMELAVCDVYSLLLQHDRLNVGFVAKTLLHISAALQYCQDRRIAHRDIKPDNFLVCTGEVIKLSDFGCACVCYEKVQGFCGTFEYNAPEIVNGLPYDWMVDNWAMGAVCYELLTGFNPFCHDNPEDTQNHIRIGIVNYNQHVPPPAFDLIMGLLMMNPAERLCVMGIMHHPFVLMNCLTIVLGYTPYITD